MRFYIKIGKRTILIAQKLTNDKKEILQDLAGDALPPPLYWMMMCPPPSAPPGPVATLMPDPGPRGVPAAALLLCQLSWRLSSRLYGRLWSRRQRPLVSAPRIALQPDLLDCIHLSQWVLMGRGKKTQELDRGCTPPRNRGKEPQYRCPSESFKNLQFGTRVGTTTHPLWPIVTSHFPLRIY